MLERRAVVVGEDLGEVLGAPGRALLEPAREGRVLGGAVGARELLVGHVADQRVHEEELGLALDRGAAHGAHELLGDQLHEALEDRGRLASADRRHGAGPEGAADDGGVGEQRLALGAEQVEARGDERADRVGQRHLGALP